MLLLPSTLNLQTLYKVPLPQPSHPTPLGQPLISEHYTKSLLHMQLVDGIRVRDIARSYYRVEVCLVL